MNTKSDLSGNFFEVLANEAIMAITAFDTENHSCIYANTMAIEILELRGDDGTIHLDNLTVQDLFPLEARGNIRPFSDEITRREGLTQDVLVRKVNGYTFIANIGVKYLDLPENKTVLMLMFQDITFQKKLQRELTLKQEEIHKSFQVLLEQNRQLRELDQAKDRFIALTTHELRTPLSAVVATAEVLKLKLYESSEQMEELIRTVHEQGLHLMELVNDVLDFAKIRAGKMDFYIEQIDVGAVLRKVHGNFRHMADQSAVSIEVDLPDQPLLCYADLLRLREIVNNVVSNAIKYNRPGGTVRISVEDHDKNIRVVVSDTGQGIAPEKLEAVFNEFETLGNVAKHHKGTGLGMPIAKRLTEAMGGTLSVKSEVDVGSQFFVEIPKEKVLSEDLYRSREDSWGDFAA